MDTYDDKVVQKRDVVRRRRDKVYQVQYPSTRLEKFRSGWTCRIVELDMRVMQQNHRSTKTRKTKSGAMAKRVKLDDNYSQV